MRLDDWPSHLAAKTDGLGHALAQLESVVVAYSGGVDSTFLAVIAAHMLGDRMLAVTIDAAACPARELEQALLLARELGLPHQTIQVDQLAIPEFRANVPERCYFCKKRMLAALLELAANAGYEHVIDGTNADDAHDFRPGQRALQECRVRSPLKELQFTKSDIRSASRLLELPTADKPSYACLASRIPYHSEVTRGKLAQVNAVEEFLFEEGMTNVRARHHGQLVRVELPVSDLQKLTTAEMRRALVRHAKRHGFTYVALDLEGYRTGSMNASLEESSK